MPAPRTIATGILDVQLIGLPDVKKQLEGIPLLMDSVAKASLNMSQRMANAQRAAGASARLAAESMSRAAAEQEAIFRKRTVSADFFQRRALQFGDSADFQRAARDRAKADEARYTANELRQAEFNAWQARDEREARIPRREFRRASVSGLKEFREAALGTQAIAALDQESAALDRLESRIDMADKANQRFVETERKRIQLSREAIHTESMRTLNPAEFARQRAITDLQAGFVGFENDFTGKAERESLEQRKRALATHKADTEFGATVMKDEKGKEKLIALTEREIALRKAYEYVTQQQIDVDEAHVKKMTDVGSKFVALTQEHAGYQKKQKDGIALTEHEATRLKQLPEELRQVHREYNAAREAGRGWNQELHKSAEGSRRANYRWQQLSFGAQDFMQVIGQTGLAGALHASANNMSMFVQTLEVANPKLLALGAFGVTAGMMAFAAWLRTIERQADPFVAAVDRMSKAYGDFAGREAYARRQVESGPLSVSGEMRDLLDEQKKLKAEYDASMKDYVSKQDTHASVTGEFFPRKGEIHEQIRSGRKAMIEDDAASYSKAMKEYIKLRDIAISEHPKSSGYKDLANEFIKETGKTDLDAIYRTLRDEGVSKTDAKSTVDRLREQKRQLNDYETKLAMLESGIHSNAVKFLDSMFASTDQRFRMTMSEAAPGVKGPARGALATEALRNASLGGMTEEEKYNKDYLGAIARLTQAANRTLSDAQSENADQRELSAKRHEFMAAIDALKEEYYRDQEQSAAYRNRISSLGATGLTKIRMDSAEKARAAIAEVDRKERERDLTPQQAAADRSRIRAQSAKDLADAESAFSDSILNSAFQQEHWNNQFAMQEKSLSDAYNEYIKRLQESGMSLIDQQSLLSQFTEGQKEQRQSLRNQKAIARLEAMDLGRFGGSSTLEDSMIDLDRQTLGVLQSIADNALLSPAEKEAQKKMAFTSRRQGQDDIRERFNKIGLTDPKSLHKQIQLSLQKTKSEEYMKATSEYSKTISETLDKIEKKPGFAIN